MPVPVILELDRSILMPTACPACRGLVANTRNCVECGRSFPSVAGIVDFRLGPDRYLSLANERRKAENLAEIAETADFASLADAYYDMTEDVDPTRRSRYLTHIAAAEQRGRVLGELLPKVGRILEVGCGTGGLLVAAAGQTATIIGVDIASRWLILARKRLESRGLTGHVWAADASHLPWPDATFDVVVADSLIEHLENPQIALAEFLRVVRPNGHLILWSPNRFSLLSDPHIGLWGLGFLPRTAQVRYVNRRRGRGWPIRVRSACEARRMAEAAGWKDVRIDPAKASGSTALHKIYNRARHWRLSRQFLRTCGPLWQLVAKKGDA